MIDAGNSKKKAAKVIAEAKEGIFDWLDYSPKMAKSVFATIAAWLMGGSLGDAIATGFGVIEEAEQLEEAEDKKNNQKIVEMLMENPEYMKEETLLSMLAQLGISKEDLPFYREAYNAASLKLGAANAKELIASNLTAIKEIRGDLISSDESDIHDEFNRLVAAIQEEEPFFDFSDAGRNWAVYEAFSDWKKEYNMAMEEGADSVIKEPIVFYHNLFGLYDAEGNPGAIIIDLEDPDQRELAGMVKNNLRIIYKNKKKADEVETGLRQKFEKEELGKGGGYNTEEEYLEWLALETNDILKSYLAKQ
jgi:hypothetical protein